MIIVVDWALVANSKSFVCGQFTYTTKSDSTVTLAYRGMRNPYIVYGHINIPSVVSDGERDYVVSEISDYAFMRTGITSVSIPGTVKKISNPWAGSISSTDPHTVNFPLPSKYKIY